METSRAAQKRRAIMGAATEVFLSHGYLGASMDEVAAKAAVSKQTVYKHFKDKENLFAEIILGTNSDLADRLAHTYATTLDAATDAGTALRDLARGFLADLTRPDVLRLRRLVLAEADRFPAVCGAWFTEGFEKSLALLGESLTRLAGRGLLRPLPDATLAAYHLAGLVMYKPMNQVMFAGTVAQPAEAELEQIADRAVDVFLAAYGPA